MRVSQVPFRQLLSRLLSCVSYVQWQSSLDKIDGEVAFKMGGKVALTKALIQGYFRVFSIGFYFATHFEKSNCGMSEPFGALSLIDSFSHVGSVALHYHIVHDVSTIGRAIVENAVR